jgi:hypothetical protein
MRLKFAFIVVLLVSSLGTVLADPLPIVAQTSKSFEHPFSPGERLTYSISWSKLVRAGIAVMEVKGGKTSDGKRTYQFVSTTTSVGLLESVYPVRDSVESIVDADDMKSLAYHLQENHGTRKRQRRLTFDHRNHTVQFRLNEDRPETFPVPERIHDALSSLYYVRTVKDFIINKPIIVNVNDSGKNWAVEVHVLGRERITTPAGDFDTIKVKTYPKYEGVFMNKGEIFIWLTDDARKIPVVMKSTISIGSIVATLTEMQDGKNRP